MLGISRWWIVTRVLVAKILVATFLTLLLVMSSDGSSNAMGVNALANPTLAIANKAKRAEPPKSSAKLPSKLSEAAPPETIQALRQELDNYQPQVTILSPRKNEVLQDNTVSVKFQVNDLPIFKDKQLGLGPHLHVLLDNNLYQAVYDLNQPLVLQNLEPGTHTLRAFASRPWHESFKNEGAYAQVTFHVYTQTEDNNPDLDLPLLTYSRPQGSYGAEPIMLDFYLTNAPLHLVAQENAKDDIADWRIRCTINGESFVLDRWLPTYLKGFKPGKNWVQLEFLDEKGNPIKNVFNNTVRVVTYEPGGKDTLSQLIRGELSVAEAKGIVDPNYIPPEPQPIPTPQASPTPETSPTPLPSVSPVPVLPLPASTPKASPPPKAVPKPAKPASKAPLKPSPTPTTTPEPSPEVHPSPKTVQPTPKASPRARAKLGSEKPIVVPRQQEATPNPSAGESKVSKPAAATLEKPEPAPVASPSPKPAEPAPKSEVRPTKPFGFDRFRNPFKSAPATEKSVAPTEPKPVEKLVEPKPAATPSPVAEESAKSAPVATPIPVASPTPKSEVKPTKPFGFDRFRNPLKPAPIPEAAKIPAAPKSVEPLAAPKPVTTPTPAVVQPAKPAPVATPAPVASPSPKLAEPTPKSEAKPTKPFGFDRFRNPLKPAPASESAKIPAAPKPVEPLAAPQPVTTPTPAVVPPAKPAPVATPAPVASPSPKPAETPKSEMKPTNPFGFDRFRNPLKPAPASESAKLPAAPKPTIVPSPNAAEPAKSPELSTDKKDGIPIKSFASPAPVRPLPSPASMKLNQPTLAPSSSVAPKPTDSSIATPAKPDAIEDQSATSPLPEKAAESMPSHSQELQNPGFGQFFDRLRQNVAKPTVSIPSGS